MSKIKLPPRVTALLTLLGGAALLVLANAIGAMERGGKAMLLVGFAAIAVGLGLSQLVWPSRQAPEGDDRSGWQRAPWPQKVVWILGGCVGVLAAAITMVMLGGKY